MLQFVKDYEYSDSKPLDVIWPSYIDWDMDKPLEVIWPSYINWGDGQMNTNRNQQPNNQTHYDRDFCRMII